MIWAAQSHNNRRGFARRTRARKRRPCTAQARKAPKAGALPLHYTPTDSCGRTAHNSEFRLQSLACTAHCCHKPIVRTDGAAARSGSPLKSARWIDIGTTGSRGASNASHDGAWKLGICCPPGNESHVAARRERGGRVLESFPGRARHCIADITTIADSNRVAFVSTLR